MSGLSSSTPSLWRPAALTDALLAPASPPVDPGELDRLRAGLVHELQSVVADLPAGEQLVVDGRRFRLAVTDPERCQAGDDFAHSPRAVRRAVGVVAVARWARGRSPAPATAVAEVLDAGVAEVAAAARSGAEVLRPPWWAEWYEGLGAGGRGVVRAEAVTWATQLATALDWERLDPSPVVGGRDDWWACPGARRLALKGRAEVRVPLAHAGGRQALLVVAPGVPGAAWRAELGFPALVATLVRGERGAPVRVVGTWPACGQFRVLPVDAAALEGAATAVVAATATWVDIVLERRRPSAAAGALSR